MKNHNDQQIEKIIGKAMNKSGLQSPSPDFTQTVMNGMENISISTATTYQPLISKKAWIMVGLVVVLFYVYLFIYTSTTLTGFIDFSFLYNYNFFRIFSGIEISTITMYAVIFTSLMLLIQVPLLKNYFGKRFLVK